MQVGGEVAPSLHDLQGRRDGGNGGAGLGRRHPRSGERLAHGDAQLVLEAGPDQVMEGEDDPAVAMAALEQEAEDRLVDALLLLHGLGRESHLPAGVAIARLDVAVEQPELNAVGLDHGQAALPVGRVMLPPPMARPDRLQRRGHAHEAIVRGPTRRGPAWPTAAFRRRPSRALAEPSPGTRVPSLSLAMLNLDAPRTVWAERSPTEGVR